MSRRSSRSLGLRALTVRHKNCSYGTPWLPRCEDRLRQIPRFHHLRSPPALPADICSMAERTSVEEELRGRLASPAERGQSSTKSPVKDVCGGRKSPRGQRHAENTVVATQAHREHNSGAHERAEVPFIVTSVRFYPRFIASSLSTQGVAFVVFPLT